MRRLIDRARLGQFMSAIARPARTEVRDSQALAKIERSHARDLADVREMFARGLIDGPRLLASFEKIEPELYRYPALDPKNFRRAVEETVAAHRDI